MRVETSSQRCCVNNVKNNGLKFAYTLAILKAHIYVSSTGFNTGGMIKRDYHVSITRFAINVNNKFKL